MNDGTSTGESLPERSIGASASARQAIASDLWELTKPRLSMLTVITAVVGYLAAQPDRNLPVLLALLVGTSFAAGGAGVLNMWMEREIDQRMARTRNRPLPAGRVQSEIAFTWGLGLCLTGDLLLWFGAHPLAGILAFITQASYLFAYTPLKQRTPWCTEIGAIPGAIPPLVGWAAAEGQIGSLGWILFGIVFFWQIPHFMAIAWSFRRDYADAGFPMWTVVDQSGNQAATRAFLGTLALVLTSFAPCWTGQATLFYTVAAAGAGIWIALRAARFLQAESRDAAARKLFFVSIGYLPLLLAALVIDRWLLA